uniref:BTB domain-containing protein n=1 Tax=Bicosoecida sp. CB-2014 TaxID=1486930 RepID=A0A7S1GAB2_9STRA
MAAARADGVAPAGRDAFEEGAVKMVVGTNTPIASNGRATPAGPFATAYAMACDPRTHMLFVPDQSGHCIHEVDALRGCTVTVLAGSGAAGITDDGVVGTAASFHSPHGIAVDVANNRLLVAESAGRRIAAIDLDTRAVTRICGSRRGETGCVPADGTPVADPEAVRFAVPHGLCVYEDYAYVCDPGNHVIVRVKLAREGDLAHDVDEGTTSLVAGVPGNGGNTTKSAGGVTGTDDPPFMPGVSGICVDASGVFYITTNFNCIFRMERIDGGRAAAAPASAAGDADAVVDGVLATPAAGGAGGADETTPSKHRKQRRQRGRPSLEPIAGEPAPAAPTRPQWRVTLIAGQHGVSGFADSVVGVTATFHTLMSPVVSPDGRELFVCCSNYHVVRRVSLYGTYAVTTLAGRATVAGCEEGVGSTAQLNRPMGMALDVTAGRLFVAQAGTGALAAITVRCSGRVTVPASSFRENMLRLLDSGDGADVTIKLFGGSTIQAHRCVLAAQCPHLAAILRGRGGAEMSEARSGVLDLSQAREGAPTSRAGGAAYHPRAVTSIVRWCYTDVLEVSSDIVVPLIAIADQWDLRRVSALCDRWVRRHIAPDNAFVIFAAARLYGCDELAVVARDFVCFNSAAVRAANGLRASGLPAHYNAAGLLEEIFDHTPSARM